MPPTKSSVEKSIFQAVQGESAELYTLQNAKGAIARVTTYGGILTELHVPDRKGALRNIVLGFPTLEEYKAATGRFGATIGRYANRIRGGTFSLDGVEFQLFKNAGDSTNNGGRLGFDKRIWKMELADTTYGASVALAYTSENMEEGFPGKLDVHVVYTLTDSNALEIEFSATTTKPTPINLTNHSYFNLNGEPSSIQNHELWIDAEYITDLDASLCATGKLRRVAGSTYDFRTEETIEDKITPKGYDVNFCLTAPSIDKPSLTLYSHKTGINLTMFTNQPGVQIYSGTELNPANTCEKFDQGYGLAIATQAYPDSVNHPKFPNSILRPGETYLHKVRYEFGLRGD